ncbi:hypothetical protein TNCT_519801 [Trichonephila clavata]|uniref:Uncharacterized protein n=1 Tax=Trichonephila clavata TaxID=2740835 RepID=A0A8X6L349_TRICU|nr:hypothetical protein TNCT_519801 [Trichonephila clavata]
MVHGRGVKAQRQCVVKSTVVWTALHLVDRLHPDGGAAITWWKTMGTCGTSLPNETTGRLANEGAMRERIASSSLKRPSSCWNRIHVNRIGYLCNNRCFWQPAITINVRWRHN